MPSCWPLGYCPVKRIFFFWKTEDTYNIIYIKCVLHLSVLLFHKVTRLFSHNFRKYEQLLANFGKSYYYEVSTLVFLRQFPKQQDDPDSSNFITMVTRKLHVSGIFLCLSVLFCLYLNEVIFLSLFWD